VTSLSAFRHPNKNFGRYAIITIVCALVVCSPRLSRSDDSRSPLYTANDVQELIHAVLRIPIDHKFTLGLIMTPSSGLPSWDPIAHYSGTQHLANGKTAYVVLINDQYGSALSDLGHADHAVGAAILSAVFLATMDAGRAGQKWKTLYTHAAQEDNALGPGAEDRYFNRHSLVKGLANSETALYGQIAPSDTPSSDEFGLPLSEPIKYGTGLLEYARLGVGAQRLIEIFEYPGALQENSTKAFIDRWFSTFGSLLPSTAARQQLASLRPLFVISTPSEQMAHQQQFSRGILALFNDVPKNDFEALGIGYDANEIRYNALAIKSVREDAILRRLISASDALDDSFTSLKEVRLQLGSAQTGDWQQIANLAGKIVGMLVQST
jgi:hypothetical protein